MDTIIKKRLILSIIVSTVAELVILLFIFWNNIFTIVTWRVIIGSFAIISGIAFIYNVALFPFEEKNKILKHSMIANPAVSMIFAGGGLLVWDQERFFVLFMVFVFGAIVFFFIGFVLLWRHLLVMAKEG